MSVIGDTLSRWSEVIVFPILWWRSKHLRHKITSPYGMGCDTCFYKAWRKGREERRRSKRPPVTPLAIVVIRPSWFQRLLDS